MEWGMATTELTVLLVILGLVGAITGPGLYLIYMGLRRIPPTAYAEMEATIADMNREQSEMRQQQAADHVEMRRLRGEIGRLEEDYRRIESYAAQLGRLFKEATGKEPPSLPKRAPVQPAPPRPITAGEPVRLQRRMMDCFSLEEVDALAFELGIDGALKGDTLEERSRSLVGAANRRGKVHELLELCRRERPDGGF